MVLGFVLYESIDLAFNVLKLGYNGVSGLYYWYYTEPEKQETTESREQEILIEMTNLMNKLEELQKELKVKNDKKVEDIKED